MSDTRQFLQLPGAQLASIEQAGDTISLHFNRVELVQEIENAFNDSLWTQAITLHVSAAETGGELPQCPCVLAGGDLTDNIYTYRNHAPLPIDWHGDVHCSLQVEGAAPAIDIRGDGLRVEQHGHPQYIRHIDKG